MRSAWIAVVAVSILLFGYYTTDIDHSIATTDTLFLFLAMAMMSTPFVILCAPSKASSSDKKTGSSDKNYPHERFGWKNWQVMQFPMSCPECSNPIEVNTLDWTGPKEACCPQCTHKLYVQVDIMYGPPDEDEPQFDRHKFSRQTWHMADFPIDCPGCGHPVEVYKLTWEGPEEAHCPNCSGRVDFDIAVVHGPRLKPEYQ